jgi:hypothetical protein
MSTAERQLVTAIPEGAEPARPNAPACPSCGRRYAVVLYEPHRQRPTYVCVGYMHGGGCGNRWTP